MHSLTMSCFRTARLLRSGLAMPGRLLPQPATTNTTAPRIQHSARMATVTKDNVQDNKLHGSKYGQPAPGLAMGEVVGGKRFADFDLAGKTFIVTGGARGLGLSLAEALVEAGGKGEDDPPTATQGSNAAQYTVWTASISPTSNGSKPLTVSFPNGAVHCTTASRMSKTRNV